MRYRALRTDDMAPHERMKALAHERRRFGDRRLHVLLKREGHVVYHKRLFRIYLEETLTVRRHGGRKRAMRTRASMLVPMPPNDRWSLDFVWISSQTAAGSGFSRLTALASAWRASLSGLRVARELNDLIASPLRPRIIISDNGPEFTSNAILRGPAADRLPHIAPGKLIQSAFIESFNGWLRDELLNEPLLPPRLRR